MESSTDIATLKRENPILYGMAKGPWMIAWSYAQTKTGRHVGSNIALTAPEPSSQAIAWATRMAQECLALNAVETLGELLQTARTVGFELGPEAFGVYLGHEISGCGISWTDTVTLWAATPIQLPRCAFVL